MQTKIENKKNVAKIVKKLYNRISEFIIGEDDDRIENTIYECLNSGKKPLTISTAESCTGGMIASKLIEVPGISENFIESIVSYCTCYRRRTQDPCSPIGRPSRA